MKDNENVTIVIATHNNVETIERTLKSISVGIRPANRIVVGDNDSTDGTYDLLCQLLGAEPVTIDGKTGLPPQFEGNINNVPIKIFRHRLTTIGNTINACIHMGHQGTTIFGFIEPTSWYAPDKIPKSIVVFNTIPSVACVVSDCDNHHEDGRVQRIFRSSFDMNRLLAHFPYDRNFLVRPQVFPKLKSGFSSTMETRDDYDLMLRISEIGLIYHIPAPLHHNIVETCDDYKKRTIAQCENLARRMASDRRSKSHG